MRAPSTHTRAVAAWVRLNFKIGWLAREWGLPTRVHTIKIGWGVVGKLNN